MSKVSETKTENIFRDFHGNNFFLEKSAIPKEYGFKSKKGTNYSGYPDFFHDSTEFAIVVEAKATNHDDAISEVEFYMVQNKIQKDIVGIAVSGQTKRDIRVSYFFKLQGSSEIKTIPVQDCLLSFEEIKKHFIKARHGEMVSIEGLVNTLKELNNTFHKEGKVRDSDRSLFFSGLMIALNNLNFRNTYKNIQALTEEEISTTKAVVLEASNLNNLIINSISQQLDSKINNLSKEYSWRDKFSFIKNVDYSLVEYKQIIELVEKKIFTPFKNEEKQDILGRAYKIFLSRAGKAENKNIILTPDHIKSLMVKLANLTKDDVFLDTCTGSGGFLMEAMEVMINQCSGNEAKIKQIKENQLLAFEVDSVLFALACSNMFLHGDGKSNILYRSSLLEEQDPKDKVVLNYIKNKKPTKIVINPPYEDNLSIKFTKQALEFLEPNGKLIIIMPSPTLTQNQKDLTKDILKIAKLDFVIKMPVQIFKEQKRTVYTSIFGFTKTPHKENNDVLFFNLEDDGFVSIQNKGRVDKNNQWEKIEETILDSILNFKEIEGLSSKKKIFDASKNLNCSGYQDISKNKSSFELIKIQDLFKIEEGSLASEGADDDGDYNFITASEDWKKHSSFSHDTEALVYAVSASGSLGRSHYVHGKFVASNLCLVLTKNSKCEKYINLQFYSYFLGTLKKKFINDLADGTSKLTIDKKLFENYYIEYIPQEVQDNFVKNVLAPLKGLREKVVVAEKRAEDEIAKITSKTKKK